MMYTQYLTEIPKVWGLVIFCLKFQGPLQNPWPNQSGEEAGKLFGCGLPQLWVLMVGLCARLHKCTEQILCLGESCT